MLDDNCFAMNPDLTSGAFVRTKLNDKRNQKGTGI